MSLSAEIHLKGSKAILSAACHVGLLFPKSGGKKKLNLLNNIPLTQCKTTKLSFPLIGMKKRYVKTSINQ